MKYPLSNGMYMIIDDEMLPIINHFAPVHYGGYFDTLDEAQKEARRIYAEVLRIG